MDVNYNELIIIFTFGIVGCGKSTLFEILEENTLNIEKINLFRVSSDKFRSQIIEDYMRLHKINDFQLAFKQTFKNLKVKFNNYLSNFFFKKYKILVTTPN